MPVKPDLSALPRHILKVNKHWYKDRKTGKWIPAEKITDHLPKSQIPASTLDKRWDLKY